MHIDRDLKASLDPQAKGPGTRPKLLLENPAEMRRVIESPEKSDLRNTFPAQIGIRQVLSAMPQPLRSDPVRYS